MVIKSIIILKKKVINIKNKKSWWVALIDICVFAIILMYIFKPMTMNDIYDEPNFKGIVLEVFESSILVSVNEEEDEIRTSDKISVSLEVKLKDSITNFEVGDKVRVFYDGTILETYPAKINEVYAILLLNE